jgi:tetratricopeptide (TPR) repeat protein
MGVGSSFRLTVQERILIHLADYSRYIDEIEVPFALTQEGIAQSIGVVRSAIPRAIKKLISNDKVKEILAHVSGVSRRRKVYHLTTDGFMIAVEIKDKLANVEIKIINEKNKTIKCKIKEIHDKLDKEIKLLDVILNLGPENVFNYIEYLELQGSGTTAGAKTAQKVPSGKIGIEKIAPKSDLSKEPGQGPGQGLETIQFIEKAPKLTYFIGRKAELDSIEKAIIDEKCKIIMVHGIAGIGKTTLASKLLEIFEKKYNLFWYRFHEWDTLRNLLTSISKFLLQFNKNKLKKYLDTNMNVDTNDVGEILEEEFNDINAIFFLDDFHKINEQLVGLFTLFREMLERLTDQSVKLLIFSRSFVPFYDRRDVLVKKMIHEIELTGLNEEESKELLKYRNVRVDNFKQLYALTQGHPLSLELLDPTAELEEQKNIKLYLEEEVLNRLSLREKSLLKIASVFRYPVPADGFFIYEKAQINRETLSILSRKALIKESLDGYEVHDLIRDFFYSYLTSQEKVGYHKLIGQFYLDRLKMINDHLKRKITKVFQPNISTKTLKTQPRKSKKDTFDVEPILEQRSRGILETQYHFIMAEDYTRAAEVAIIMGHELLSLTYVEELVNNLEKIEQNLTSDEFSLDLKILKADSMGVLGNLNNAQELYQQSLKLAEAENNKTKLAEIFCKLGFIKEKLNEYDSAIELLNKSLEISKTIGDAKSISDAYGSLGDVYWKMTQFDKSNKYYNKCLESAESITDLPGKAKTFLLLGIQSAKHGKLEESLKYYERCLDILDKGKELDGINYAKFYENLGDHYLKTIFSYFIQNENSS